MLVKLLLVLSLAINGAMALKRTVVWFRNDLRVSRIRLLMTMLHLL
jgi:hypothetical protein